MSLPKTLFSFVNGSDEYVDCLLAKVTLTRRNIEELLSLMDECQRVREKNSRWLNSMDFDDCEIDWFENWSDEADEEVTMGEWGESSAHPGVDARTDLNIASVGPNHVFWSCYLKNTSIRYETPMLNRDFLEQLLPTLAEDLAAETETA